MPAALTLSLGSLQAWDQGSNGSGVPTGTSSGPSVWHGNGDREAAEVTGAGGVGMVLDGDVESNVFVRTQEVT